MAVIVRDILLTPALWWSRSFRHAGTASCRRIFAIAERRARDELPWLLNAVRFGRIADVNLRYSRSFREPEAEWRRLA
jgi:hypothetical protein